MSKGRGKRIVIKFDKALLGDVTGNESAFTVTGMEKDPLFYGEPALREYAVESVERYPLTVFWEDDFSGTMDGVEVGENGVVLSKEYIPVNVLATYIDVGATTFTVPTGINSVNVLIVGGGGGGGSRQGGGGGAGGLILETGIPVTPEDEISVTVGGGGAGGTSGGRGSNGGNSAFGALTAIGGGGGGGRTTDNIGASGGSGGGGAFRQSGGSGTTGQGNDGGSATDDNAGNAGGGGGGAGGTGEPGTGGNETAVGGDGGQGIDLSELLGDELGDNGWFAGGGGGGTFSVGSMPGVGGQGGGGDGAGGTGGNTPGSPAMANTGGGGGGSEGASGAGGNGGSGIVVVYTGGADAFIASGTHTPHPIPIAPLPESPRLRYEADTPAGTSITIEYATNNSDTTPPETWAPADDNDILTITPTEGYFLWLRFTLSTEDTAVTPTLLSVWLEEAEAPPDTILLTMAETGRFNNVEGDLTVVYDQTKGNLAGARPVPSFEVSFTPTDLEPSPVHEHIVTVRGEPLVSFIPVSYEGYPDHAEHTIAATAGPINIAFIHVDDIPP